MSLVDLRNKKTGVVELKPLGYADAFPDFWEVVPEPEPPVSVPVIDSPKRGKKEATDA